MSRHQTAQAGSRMGEIMANLERNAPPTAATSGGGATRVHKPSQVTNHNANTHQQFTRNPFAQPGDAVSSKPITNVDPSLSAGQSPYGGPSTFGAAERAKQEAAMQHQQRPTMQRAHVPPEDQPRNPADQRRSHHRGERSGGGAAGEYDRHSSSHNPHHYEQTRHRGNHDERQDFNGEDRGHHRSNNRGRRRDEETYSSRNRDNGRFTNSFNGDNSDYASKFDDITSSGYGGTQYSDTAGYGTDLSGSMYDDVTGSFNGSQSSGQSRSGSGRRHHHRGRDKSGSNDDAAPPDGRRRGIGPPPSFAHAPPNRLSFAAGGGGDGGRHREGGFGGGGMNGHENGPPRPDPSAHNQMQAELEALRQQNMQLQRHAHDQQQFALQQRRQHEGGDGSSDDHDGTGGDGKEVSFFSKHKRTLIIVGVIGIVAIAAAGIGVVMYMTNKKKREAQEAEVARKQEEIEAQRQQEAVAAEQAQLAQLQELNRLQSLLQQQSANNNTAPIEPPTMSPVAQVTQPQQAPNRGRGTAASLPNQRQNTVAYDDRMDDYDDTRGGFEQPHQMNNRMATRRRPSPFD